MAVRCSKCGEELLGAVNRCWKCGQAVAMPQPPEEPLDAVVVEATPADGECPFVQPPHVVVMAPTFARPRTTAELIDARRSGMMAVGGAVAAVALGLFSTGFSLIWAPAAIVAVLGLAMGVWGLSSPRRNWALVGMLLCCLAIGLGTYQGVRAVYRQVQAQQRLDQADLDGSP